MKSLKWTLVESLRKQQNVESNSVSHTLRRVRGQIDRLKYSIWATTIKNVEKT